MDNFQAQTVGTNRALRVQADGTTFDPANPPAGATLSGQFPKTSFHMTPMGTDPIFIVHPSSRNYGTVLMDTMHNQTFTIMNVGGGILGINSIAIAGSPHFSIQNMPTLPASLNTGQSITFTGRYNPTAAGTHAATITIIDDIAGVRNAERTRQPRTTHTVELSGICVDPTITALPHQQNFDAVTAPALPVQWSKILTTTSTGNVITTTVNPQSPPNCVSMTNTADANAGIYLIAPPLINTIPVNTTRIKFHGRSSNASLVVGVMTNPQDTATFTEIQTVQISGNTWTEYVVTLAGYTGTGRSIAFRLGTGATYVTAFLDNFMIEVTPQNDLAALSVMGNTTPSVGMATNYIVNVFNWGTNQQTNYQVKLYKQGDIEVGTVPGTQVNPGQTVQITVPWTPDVEGNTFIYAKVLLTGDENPLNDQSPNLNVSVQPAGLVALTIGAGDQLARIPLDMYYMNSLYECIYYPAELSNTIGMIYGIGFYNDFATNLPNKPTKIWLGTTTQNDLAAGWIPSTQMALVFDGNVNYPSGQNLIHITFD
ncbi:MAG: choice-of-anchor D domain-containing protein, partial [Candidatus Cloacimonadaceae bacterium]|nr:choice-of-anchor D domain-containing protein [Candidatus Cloacimonadaceae bacterium]